MWEAINYIFLLVKIIKKNNCVKLTGNSTQEMTNKLNTNQHKVECIEWHSNGYYISLSYNGV